MVQNILPSGVTKREAPGRSVPAEEEAGHPPISGEPDYLSSPISIQEAILQDENLLGFVAGFALAHEGHAWTLIGYPPLTSVYHLWCYQCREGRLYDSIISAEQMAADYESLLQLDGHDPALLEFLVEHAGHTVVLPSSRARTKPVCLTCDDERR